MYSLLDLNMFSVYLHRHIYKVLDFKKTNKEMKIKVLYDIYHVRTIRLYFNYDIVIPKGSYITFFGEYFFISFDGKTFFRLINFTKI